MAHLQPEAGGGGRRSRSPFGSPSVLPSISATGIAPPPSDIEARHQEVVASAMGVQKAADTWGAAVGRDRDRDPNLRSERRLGRGGLAPDHPARSPASVPRRVAKSGVLPCKWVWARVVSLIPSSSSTRTTHGAVQRTCR